ncbi:hypothetical protein ALI144C_07910 [Actinosynnema sp. ALI-1.44]|nr:hypothetical protein ALI144C_07910 [Actinosynnema sp. ALI-1.44]
MVWVLAVVVLMFGGCGVMIYREYFMTRTWDGAMTFRIVHIGPERQRIESVPGTADSPPLREFVNDDVPVGPGKRVGDLVRCQLTQTFLPNEDLAQGPHSRIISCT